MSGSSLARDSNLGDNLRDSVWSHQINLTMGHSFETHVFKLKLHVNYRIGEWAILDSLWLARLEPSYELPYSVWSHQLTNLTMGHSLISHVFKLHVNYGIGEWAVLLVVSLWLARLEPIDELPYSVWSHQSEPCHSCHDRCLRDSDWVEIICTSVAASSYFHRAMQCHSVHFYQVMATANYYRCCETDV